MAPMYPLIFVRSRNLTSTGESLERVWIFARIFSISGVDCAFTVAGRPKLNAVMITESAIAKCVFITRSLQSFELRSFWQPLFQRNFSAKVRSFEGE